MSHDQNFKNLILDYPRASLAFFAEAEGANLPEIPRILPIRQEQLKERLGERFRELDIPLLVEWPDGQREAILFVIEEETDPKRFSIYRLAHYCLDLAEMFAIDRVVLVVIFLRPGSYPLQLQLRGEQLTYLSFSFLACDLGRLPVDRYLNSDNIVAQINLPNMQYNPSRRIEVYASAQNGLVALESNLEKRRKYLDFIEQYANLSEAEWIQYRAVYLPKSKQREVVMGLIERGRNEGIREGLLAGIELGLELKFGDAGLQLLPEIRQVDKLDVLRNIHEGLRTAETPEALQRIYRN